MASTHRRPSSATTLANPISIKTNVFPTKRHSRSGPPPVAPIRTTSLSRASFTRSADEEDAESLASANRARGARYSQYSELPLEAQEVLLSSPPRPRSDSTARRPTEDVYQADKATSSMMSKGLSALSRTLSRKSSAVSLAEIMANSAISAPLLSDPGRGFVAELSPFVTGSQPFPAPLSAKSRNLSKASEPDLIPKSWFAYSEAYARGSIDLDDPPFPPESIASQHPSQSRDSRRGSSTPFEEKNYLAPRPPNEHVRQRILARIDLFGKNQELGGLPRSSVDGIPFPSAPLTADSDSNSSNGSERDLAPSPRKRSFPEIFPARSARSSITFPSVNSRATPSQSRSSLRTIVDDPALLHIIASARQVFDAPMVFISVLQNEQHVFLASDGMPEGVESLPRGATYCSHTVLGGRDGMVVLDTRKDWRFTKNIFTIVMGARFYAGVPIFLSESCGGKGCLNVAIGTVAIMDTKPRTSFTPFERSQLHDFSREASMQISNWISGRPSAAMCLQTFSSWTSGRPVSTFSNNTFPTFPSATSPAESKKAQPVAIPKPRKNLESQYRGWQAELQSHLSSFPSPPSSSASTSPTLRRNEGPRINLPDSPPSSLRRPSTPRKGSHSSLDPTPRGTPIMMIGEEEVGRELQPGPIFTFPPTPPKETSRKSSPANTISPPRRPSRSPARPSNPVPTVSEDPFARFFFKASYVKAEVVPVASPNSSPSTSPTSTSPTSSAASILPPFLSPASRHLQSIFDLAIDTLASRCQLALCYLVVLHIPNTDFPAGDFSLLALHHTTMTPPTLDVTLHLRALQNDEGGLLYRRPAGETEEESPYESGILLPVAETDGLGILLAGFKSEGSEEFGEEDLAAFQKIVRTVRRCVLKASAGRRNGGREMLA